MAAERIPSHLVPSLFPNVYTRCPVGSVPHRETHQRCHEPASSSTVRKEGHECVRTLVTRVPGVPSTFPLVLARVQVIADSDILCDEIGGGSNRDPESPRIARPTTLNYESWSVMDKLAYTTTTNLRLRLAGMLMDMWIFFLFVAIAGECETILFLISRFARVTLRYVSIRFDAIFRYLGSCSRSSTPLRVRVRVRSRSCIDSTSGSQHDLVRVLSLDVSIRITYAQQARAAR